MQRGTWLVERRFSDKPKVVTRHSGVSYACLLVPVVRHSPTPRQGKRLRQGVLSLETQDTLTTIDLAGSEGLEGTKVNIVKPQKIVFVSPLITA